MWRRKVRILHVEDDPSFQAIVRVSLAQLGGHYVDTAGDAGRALVLAAAHAPDLVILDLELPGENGLETLRELRALGGMDRVPVIFLTGSSDMMRSVEMLASGAVTVLQKPCRPRRLLDAVTAALGLPPPSPARGEGAP
ncbi:MAG TPA: response regulator [Burkholderiales bacterium]|nr:response regulator [Burkholderiales bacterium]